MEKQTKILFLALALVSIVPMSFAYGVEITADKCESAITEINSEHWEATDRKDMSWYGAGLILARHYIDTDCDNAGDKLDMILADLWNVDKEEKVDRDIIDDISAGIRFAKRAL